jgi:hypothetical protein
VGLAVLWWVASGLVLVSAAAGTPAQGPAPQCEAAAGALRRVPGVRVTRSQGTFEDEVARRRLTGCRVTATGRFRAFRRDQPAPTDRVAEALGARGLARDHRYDADGPDGTAFAFRGGGVICLVQGRWDGGDDSDPSYRPDDRYEVTVGCASDPSPSP